jgi:hypothetical protein
LYLIAPAMLDGYLTAGGDVGDDANLASACLQLVIGQTHGVQERVPAWVVVKIGRLPAFRKLL